MISGKRLSLAASVAAVLVAGTALAGGPLYTYDYASRVTYAWKMASWPNGKVPVYTDLGPLGVLTNERANELVSFATTQWSGVPTSSFRNAVVGDLSFVGVGDITGGNVGTVIGAWNGGGIDVIYDSDGSILTNFFGTDPRSVLGITNIDFVAPNGPEILEAWMVLSGPGIHAVDTNGVGFQGVVTHEMGHALNLAHSQTNGAVENGATQDPPAPSGCGAPWSGMAGPVHVETMYPISTPEPGKSGEYMGTVDLLDDRSALSDIYPAARYPGSRGTIRGEIRDASGHLVTGVNVIARLAGDPFNDASSYISGQVSKGQAGPDGTFVLNDLDPGGTYVLYVDNLLNGAFQVPRLVALPGPEEYFNGTMESGDASTDGRCGWTTIMAVAGAPVTADVTFNHLPGAPTFLEAPDAGVPEDITPDGSIVVGRLGGGSTSGPVFRWDWNAGTFEDLGGVVTGQASISDDGMRISAGVRDTDNALKAAIFEDGLWTPIPPVAGAVPCNNTSDGPTYTSAFDISGDGATVVGLSYGPGGCYNGTTRGFKWTAGGGTVQLPKIDTFDRAGRANAVNYNGTVIVGWDDASSGLRRGAQWRNGVASFIKYGTQPVGEGIDVSRDGQYVVGSVNFATNFQFWRNRPSSGTEITGGMPGQTGGTSNSISDDYGVMTGYSTNLNTGVLTPAIWTSALRWSDLNQFFASQGVNTEGALPVSGTAMSADGRTIVGHMQTRFGFVPWVLSIPTVLVCHSGTTQTVDFPQGMNAALGQGDTLGPCQCNAAAPTDLVSLLADQPLAGTARLTWDPVAGATGYDLARGTLAALRTRGGSVTASTNACLENDLNDVTSDDTDVPDAGDGYWYLVRATSCGGAASFDSGAPSQVASRDAGIGASPVTCP